MFLKFRRWRKKRFRKYIKKHSSWLDCKGNPDRSRQGSLWTLILYKFLSYLLWPLPMVKSDIMAAVVAPQNKQRFWQGINVRMSSGWFAPTKDFMEYLKDETQCKFSALPEMIAWLRNCDYVSDLKQFDCPDYWQSPSEFEKRRRGDCEDYALWLWHHLCKIGQNARFVVGMGKRPHVIYGHAWVVLIKENENVLIECTSKNAGTMMLSENEAQHFYLPFFSVDNRCQIFWHG